MIFVHPERLWLLTLLPILVLWAIRARSRRRRAWQSLAQRGRAPRDGTLWWFGTMAFLILAIAQPRWGRLASSRPPGHDAILVVDVSRSMATQDAVPYRLAVAVEAAEGLVKALGRGPADRVGVVAFAGRGLLVCPLTENLGAVIDVLHRLHPGSVQPGGTDVGAGLDAALEAFGADEHAHGQTIVIFSDGEDLADRWRTRLDRLREKNVMVHTVTIGDPDEGHPVPSGADNKPLVYRGETVLSKRSDGALEAIAHETGGSIIRLGLTSLDLGELYRTRIEPAARRRAETPRIGDLAEQFPLFLAAALTCLIAGVWPPGRGWSWRVGWLWPGTWWWRRAARAAGRVWVTFLVILAAMGAGQPPGGWRGLAAVVTGMSPPGTGHPARRESAADLVARGRAAYEGGRLDEALSHFESAARLAPTVAVTHYDAAAALFRLKRYEEARQRYVEARRMADPSLNTKIAYALGNTALVLGDIPGAIQSYDECIASTARGAGLDEVRHDAEINREFAVRQAQSPTMPQGQGPENSPASQKPDRRKGQNPRDRGENPGGEGEPETGPSAGGAGSDDGTNPNGRERPRRTGRRFGGAGGSQTRPPGAPGESPDDRLDAALENIRDAQSRRLPDEPPPASARDDRRDW